MSNNIPKSIQNSTDFNSIEDGQLCYEGNKMVYRDGDNRVELFDTYTEQDALESFTRLGSIPIDRFGDNTYLPLDIKGDFKGSVSPENSKTAFMIENDGSMVGLRPGYNGNFQHIFYFYSQSGIYDKDSITYTDQLYSPSFLNITPTIHEIVSRILATTETGMLVLIRDMYTQSYSRYYWINFNDTMDSDFHSYVDVSDTISSYGLSSLVYVPEKDMFIGARPNIVQVMFFNNNLPTQWDYVPINTISSTLTTKNMNVVNELTGITSIDNKFLNGYSSTRSQYLTILPNVNGNSPSSIAFPTTSKNIPQFTYQVVGSEIYGYVRYVSRIVFTDGLANNFSLIYRIKITSTNVVSLYTHDATEQSLPYVYGQKTFPNTTNVGTAEEKKANHYPLLAGYDYFTNETVVPMRSGNNYGVSQVNNYAYMYSIKTTGRVYCQKPLLFSNSSNDTVTGFTISPPDATVLGKEITSFAFIGESNVVAASLSMTGSQTSPSVKVINASVDANSRRTIDYGTLDALSLPSSVTQYATSDLYSGNYSRISTLYDSGKYRNMPYRFTLGSNLNGMEVLIHDENKQVDATSGYNGRMCKFPNDASTKLNTVLTNILSTTNLPNPDLRTATVSFINENGSDAYLLMTFCATTYGVTNYLGVVVLKCSHVNRELDFANIQVHEIAYLPELVGSQITATTKAETGSHGLFNSGSGIYINISGAGYGTVGGNSFPDYAIELNYTGNVSRIRYYSSTASWIKGLCGVHPTFGLFNTNLFDNFGTRAKIRYIPPVGSTPHARIEDSFNKLLSGTGMTSLVLLTIEPPSSFNLYMTNIPLQFQGYSYVLEAQSINFLQQFTNPYNKTFYSYVKRNSLGDVVLDISETEQSETEDTMYIGTITTTSSNISSVDIKKRTRINMYGLSDFSDFDGNSIQYNIGAPDQSFDDAPRYALMFNPLESGFYRSLFTPPSPSSILNSWARTDAQTYYPDPSQIPASSEASKWFIDGSGDFVQPNNTVHLNTLLSPEYLDRYTFETTLTSNNSDDDYIGIVVAADYVNGEFITILAGIHAKGLGASPKFSLQLYRNGYPSFNTGEVIVGENGLANLTPGWANNSVKIKVVKDRNIITAYRGDSWNSNNYSSTAILSIDIYDLSPDVHFLADKQRYGFATMSQAGSKYVNYSITRPVNYSNDVVYNTNNQKHTFNMVTNQWVLQPQTPSVELGYPRVVVNPLTMEQFKFDAFGGHTVISDNAITYNGGGNMIITTTPNSTTSITKAQLEQSFSSLYGSVTFVQVVSYDNLIVQETSTSLNVNSWGSNGKFYVYFSAGEIVGFQEIEVKVN